MTPYYQDEAVTIYHGDCRDVLPSLGRFDLLLTDPPYGLGGRLHGGSGEWSEHFSEAPAWDVHAADESLVLGLLQFADKAVVWGGNYYPMPPVRGWLAWDKKQEHSSGHFEMAWTNLDIPTRIFRLSRVEAYSMGKVHPTEKPESLMRWCIEKAGAPATILDPFMGSGTTLVAAKRLGRKAIGIEREEKYCEVAAKRLRQGALDLFANEQTA